MLEKFFKKKESIKRVLIVEDDSMLSSVLAESLKVEKFKVEIVANGLEVLAEVIKFQPHIILLDLIIPGIDGFEVLKQLKEESKTANIPVVVLSNLNQPSDVKAAKALGAEKYFLKAVTQLDDITKYIKDKLK